MRTQKLKLRSVVLGLLLLVATSAPAFAQDVVPTLRAVRASLPTPMSKAQLSELLNRTVSQHPGWALLRKDSGNNCPTPYPGVSVSCDWLVYAPTRWGYDILRDQEGAATIVESGGEAIGAGAELVYPWPVDGAAVPPPVTSGASSQPPPGVVQAPPVDLGPVYQRLDALSDQAERMFADLTARDAARQAQIAAVSAQVKQHDEAPTFVGKLFGSRYTQILMTAAAAWFTAQQTTK